MIGPVEAIDYLDSQTQRLPRPTTPLEAWNIIMGRPQPLLRLAFRIRDVISARFGVQKIGGFSGKRTGAIKVGDRLDFFAVEGVSPDALILTARDRHLDVMTCISVEGATITITSSVITHNWFGRAYMVPVGPAHRLIVRRMLRRLACELT
jgi:hypothetical protein